MNRLPWIPVGLLLASLLAVSSRPAQGQTDPSYVPEAIRVPMALDWKFSSVDLGAPLPARNNQTSPVVAGNVVYVCARGVTPDRVATTSVYALSLETGEKLWDHPLEGNVFGSPAVADNTLWVADIKGYLYALDTKDGSEKTRFKLSRATRCTPVVHNGVVYIGDDAGQVVAIDAKTAQERWHFNTEWPVDAPITVSDEQGLVLVATTEPMVYALRIDKGTEYWRHKMPGGHMEAAPLCIGQNLYIVSGRYLMCMTIRKGMDRWQVPVRDEPLIGTPAVCPDGRGGVRLYFTCRDGTVTALNALTGALAWRSPVLLDRIPRSAPIVTQNAVLVGADSGVLFALSVTDGSLLWRYRLLPPKDITGQNTPIAIAGTPAVAEGRVVVLGDEGTVACFSPTAVDTTPPEVTDTEPNSHTPVYGRPPVNFRAIITDEGSGVNDFRLVMKLDGQVVKHHFSPGTGEITYATPVTQPIKPLADGSHTVTISVVDWFGNKNDFKWVFQVDNRRIPTPQPVNPGGMGPGMMGAPGVGGP